tara:strand:- start:749 stop:949 length:201 start_codon:yes stop_codon:yes gene_type:complete
MDRRARKLAKISGDLIQSDMEYKEDNFIRQATSIHRDVSTVWVQLILNSGEISAIGGWPEQRKESA